MNDFLSDRARITPERPALYYEGRVWTYAGLNAEVSSVCLRLHAVGVRKGDRVAVFLPNRPEYVLLVHSLVRLAAVIVPLNIRLTRAEISEQLSVVEADWLVVSGGERLLDGLLPPEKVLNLETLSGATGEGWSEQVIDLDQDWGILFTSGTSGSPKGAVLTLGNLFFSAMASALRLGTRPDDRWLLAMPLYHVGGLSIVFRCAIYGTAVVLRDGFDPELTIKDLERYRVTLVSLVPTMLLKLLDRLGGERFPAQVRVVLLGGSAAREELVSAALMQGVPLALTYGLTEAASQVATALEEAVMHKPGSVGKPLFQTSLRIANESGEALPTGEYGEIQVQGPTVMRGYLGHKPHEGWLKTGDIGYIDADGDLFVMQRRTDLIVSGGENVYPSEVEKVFQQHPGVADVCVVGLPDATWGQRVAALIVPSGVGIDNKALDVFLRSRLAGFKVPKTIAYVSELPVTPSGKVCRPDVVEILEKFAKSEKTSIHG